MTRPTVTLYTKPGCHLCEAVEQAIAQVARRRPLEVVLRNILDDPADLERYQYEIPVVLLDGVETALPVDGGGVGGGGRALDWEDRRKRVNAYRRSVAASCAPEQLGRP